VTAHGYPGQSAGARAAQVEAIDRVNQLLAATAPALARAVPQQPLVAASVEGMTFLTELVGPCGRAVWAFYDAVLHHPETVTEQMWTTLAAQLRTLATVGDQLSPRFVDNLPGETLGDLVEEQRQLPPS